MSSDSNGVVALRTAVMFSLTDAASSVRARVEYTRVLADWFKRAKALAQILTEWSRRQRGSAPWVLSREFRLLACSYLPGRIHNVYVHANQTGRVWKTMNVAG